MVKLQMIDIPLADSGAGVRRPRRHSGGAGPRQRLVVSLFSGIDGDAAASLVHPGPRSAWLGDSQRLPVDASRGVRDYSDDLHALVESVGLTETPFHLLGWSLGGGVAMQYAIDHPAQIASLTLLAPASPYGFGGTKGADGVPCFPDYAGSGGGTANPEFVRRLGNGDAGQDNDASPRVMNAFYFKPPFGVSKALESEYVAAMLKTAVGEGTYPGDSTSSQNWPMIAPGKQGNNNAIAPGNFNTAAIINIDPQLPILWVRVTVTRLSRTRPSLIWAFPQIGAVPGWPGVGHLPAPAHARPDPCCAGRVRSQRRALRGRSHRERGPLPPY